VDEFQRDPISSYLRKEKCLVGAEKVFTKRMHPLSGTDDAKLQGDHASNNPSERADWRLGSLCQAGMGVRVDGP
jgi:hypothetical protein